MSTNYLPIACILYDTLEELAIRKIDVEILYVEDDIEKTIINKIVDFQTLNKEEFLITSTKIKIRLDKIISVNGIDFKNSVC